MKAVLLIVVLFGGTQALADLTSSGLPQPAGAQPGPLGADVLFALRRPVPAGQGTAADPFATSDTSREAGDQPGFGFRPLRAVAFPAAGAASRHGGMNDGRQQRGFNRLLQVLDASRRFVRNRFDGGGDGSSYEPAPAGPTVAPSPTSSLLAILGLGMVAEMRRRFT